MKRITEKGHKHHTATVYIFSDESPKRLLLVDHVKFGKWIPPGGHIDPDENPYQAVIREAKEETGVDISEYLPTLSQFEDGTVIIPKPRYLLEERIHEHKDVPLHYHIDCVYVVTVPFQEISHQESELNGIAWFTEDEIKDLSMFGNVRKQIEIFFNETTPNPSL